MTRDELIKNPKDLKPHVVLLGAGASLAAFPNGERTGKQLPVMNNFVQILGLGSELRANNIDSTMNFEEIYANITNEELKKKLEEKIFAYFTSLSLPEETTLYDWLLLSLREKDAIFTFNWDPFLFDAYMRNRDNGMALPEIFFLHGNVRLVACTDHYSFSYLAGICNTCHKPCFPVPLLYPVKQKNYYNANSYIKNSWEYAQQILTGAFTLTIFGYGAPDSDVKAVELLEKAWFRDSGRELEHVEIVDIDSAENVERKWSKFTRTHHLQIHSDITQSWLWKWPRRSCEALLAAMSRGEPSEDITIHASDDLSDLQNYFKEICKYE